MSRIDPELVTLARHHLWTSRLMGVEFVPVNHRSEIQATSAVAEVVADAGPALFAEAPSAPSQPRPSQPRAASPRTDREHKRAALLELLQRHDASCPHCTTATYHTRTVFGEGDPDARLMFIGEAPGEDEDRTGRPFVGRAGQKLTEIIKAMGFEREQVYIANILKSRPPENRAPLPNEVAACSPYLREQIHIIQPAVIVALGNPASKMLLKTEIGITRLRGQWGVYSDADPPVPVMPTFHPAYLLRNYTKETRQQMWSDMQAVLKRLAS